MKLYRITDWGRHYETHETKKLIALKWVPLPNKHDGLTFRQIGQEKNAPALFAAWILMVQLASKADRDHRGQLISNGRPLTAKNMSLVTGFPESMFAQALDYFTQKHVGWMDAEDYNLELPLSPGEPGDSTGQTGFSPENIPLNGKEGKGIEGKGTEENGGAGAPGDSLPFESHEFSAAWSDFCQHRKEIKHKLTPMTVRQIFASFSEWGEQRSIEAIRFTIFKGWRGIKEPDERDRRNLATVEPRFNRF